MHEAIDHILKLSRAQTALRDALTDADTAWASLRDDTPTPWQTRMLRLADAHTALDHEARVLDGHRERAAAYVHQLGQDDAAQFRVAITANPDLDEAIVTRLPSGQYLTLAYSMDVYLTDSTDNESERAVAELDTARQQYVARALRFSGVLA